MPVTRGEQQAHYQGKTLPQAGGPTPSRRSPQLREHPSFGFRPNTQPLQQPRLVAPRNLGPSGNFHFVRPALSRLLGGAPKPYTIHEHGLNLHVQRTPSQLQQLKQASGYSQVAPVVAHPMRFIQRQRSLPPQQKANSAIFAHLLGFGNPPGAAAAERSGLAVARAAFKGDLSGEMFGHGAPVPWREFNYSKRNPNAILHAGVYANTLPQRFGQFASMSPASNRNTADWLTARFLDENAARKFAAEKVASGHEVEGSRFTAENLSQVADHLTPEQRKEMVASISRSPDFTHVVKRVYALTPRAAEAYVGDTGVSSKHLSPDVNPIIGGHKAQIRLGMRERNPMPGSRGPILGEMAKNPKLGRTFHGKAAEHIVVRYRPDRAPAVHPMGVVPGTRLFDLNAPIDPGEATKAMQLIKQRLGMIGQFGKRQLLENPAASNFGVQEHEDPKQVAQSIYDWTKNALNNTSEQWGRGHDFTSADRLAALAAAGRTRYAGERLLAGWPRDVHRPPTGRDLLGLIKESLNYAGDSIGRVSHNQEHILSNPNAILRGMGYHGLIDPEFSIGSGTGKEIVMFDKHRFEPFPQHLDRLRQNEKNVPIGVRMARQLKRGGIDFMGAIRSVRSGQTPQATLPLSDELNMNVVKVGNKVRFFISPAKHPDAVGQELNGVQALNYLHHYRFVRRGGQLSKADVNRAMGLGGPINADAAEGQLFPVGQTELKILLRGQNKDLQERYARLFDSEKTTSRHELEQTQALGKEREAVQAKNMKALFDKGPVTITGMGGRAHLGETYTRHPSPVPAFGKHVYKNSKGDLFTEEEMRNFLNSATSVNGKRLPVSDSPDKGALGGLKLNYREGYYPPSLNGDRGVNGTFTGLYIDKNGKAYAHDFVKDENGQFHPVSNSRAVKEISDPADVRDFMQANFHLPRVVRPSKKAPAMAEIEAKLRARGNEVGLPSGNGQMSVTKNGVRLPPEAFPFKRGMEENHLGIPVGMTAKPPRWYEMLEPGALQRLLEGTPGDSFEEKAHFLDLNYQPAINQAWQEQRLSSSLLPGRAPVEKLPQLARAMQLARQHGLRGQEARLFVKTYLRERGLGK